MQIANQEIDEKSKHYFGTNGNQLIMQGLKTFITPFLKQMDNHSVYIYIYMFLYKDIHIGKRFVEQ